MSVSLTVPRFHQVFDPQVAYSYPDNVGRGSWYSRVILVYHAEVTQYYKNPSSLTDIRRGVPHFPLLSPYTHEVIETTWSHHRFLHLHSIANNLHGLWFVFPRWKITSL